METDIQINFTNGAGAKVQREIKWQCRWVKVVN
jgi:hypothetical protein